MPVKAVKSKNGKHIEEQFLGSPKERRVYKEQTASEKMRKRQQIAHRQKNIQAELEKAEFEKAKRKQQTKLEIAKRKQQGAAPETVGIPDCKVLSGQVVFQDDCGDLSIIELEYQIIHVPKHKASVMFELRDWDVEIQTYAFQVPRSDLKKRNVKNALTEWLCKQKQLVAR